MRDVKTSQRPIGVLRLALAATVLAGALPLPSFSQADPAARAAYLRTVGLSQEALELEQALLEALQSGGDVLPPARQENVAAFFAFVLALNGLTAEKAARLQAEGVDVVHAITAEARPLVEQALLADLVIVGEVVGVQETAEPGDGYRSSIGVHVRRTLKGEAPADTVVIRQRSGLADEAGRAASRDLKLARGEMYLFLLSNPMYRFSVATRGVGQDTVSIPEATLRRHYVIYRGYRMEADRLLWGRFSRQETEHAFEEIRLLDRLLASL